MLFLRITAAVEWNVYEFIDSVYSNVNGTKLS